jgi:hypothetical protein
MGHSGKRIKKSNFFPECNTRGRGFYKKRKISSPSVALGEEVLSKKKADDTDGVKSSLSARTALGEVYDF